MRSPQTYATDPSLHVPMSDPRGSAPIRVIMDSLNNYPVSHTIRVINEQVSIAELVLQIPSVRRDRPSYVRVGDGNAPAVEISVRLFSGVIDRVRIPITHDRVRRLPGPLETVEEPLRGSLSAPDFQNRQLQYYDVKAMTTCLRTADDMLFVMIGGHAEFTSDDRFVALDDDHLFVVIVNRWEEWMLRGIGLRLTEEEAGSIAWDTR